MGMLKKRLVYRGDVYNALEKVRINSICEILTDRYKDGFHDGIKKAEEIIANDVEDVPSAQEWISVEERLPERGEVVLAFGTKSSTTGQFQGIGSKPWFWWWKGNTIKRVTHWMPLPEPPKEKS